MIRSSEVWSFAEKAQKTELPGGLYGVFGETDLECEILWRYLEDYAKTCGDVIANTPQREITFRSGTRIRSFCATWRTFFGLRFSGVLLADELIRDRVYGNIKHTLAELTPREPLKFGL
jgi:hypothetical protein